MEVEEIRLKDRRVMYKTSDGKWKWQSGDYVVPKHILEEAERQTITLVKDSEIQKQEETESDFDRFHKLSYEGQMDYLSTWMNDLMQQITEMAKRVIEAQQGQEQFSDNLNHIHSEIGKSMEIAKQNMVVVDILKSAKFDLSSVAIIGEREKAFDFTKAEKEPNEVISKILRTGKLERD